MDAAAGPAHPPLPRLTRRGLAGMAIFYLVFGTLYAGTISFAVRSFQPDALAGYLARVLLLDYPLKALWTFPVWWLLFRGPLRNRDWSVRLRAHAVLGPAWVAAWFLTYYAVQRGLGQSGIDGDGRVWDLYIPVLFYGMQFGVLHVVEFAERLRWQGRRQQALQAQAHHSAVAALKAQINPHFLFNTLNSISASVPPELETTRELIARLAHTFRFVLQASRRELLPLAEEIGFLRAYLELEQARFGARLGVEFAVSPALLGVPVPPMLLQPLVENAVRHGLSRSLAGGVLTVTIAPAGPDSIRVEVADTGVGLLGQPPARLLAGQAGVGLANIHARLLALGSPGLEIAENQPSGLRVAFLLPVHHDQLPAPEPESAALLRPAVPALL